MVYEALSAIADKRFEFTTENRATCISTTKGKSYFIMYDLSTMSIMSNDNMAYYMGETSYPMIALLLVKKVLTYDEKILAHLKSIPWKTINRRNKGDYMKSVLEVLAQLQEKGVDVKHIDDEAEKIYGQVLKLEIGILGKKMMPASGA